MAADDIAFVQFTSRVHLGAGVRRHPICRRISAAGRRAWTSTSDCAVAGCRCDMGLVGMAIGAVYGAVGGPLTPQG